MDAMTGFLSLYSNPGTRRTYAGRLKAFLDFTYGSQRSGPRATEQENFIYADLLEQYLSNGRNYLDDLLRYAAGMGDLPPNTATMRLNCITELLAYRGIEFRKFDLKRVVAKLPKGGSRTLEKDLDHQVLKAILDHMDVRGRALYLTIASTGMRMGETLSIRIPNVDLDGRPPAIDLRGETVKGGVSRYVFITDEAAAAIREWLKVREQSMALADRRSAGVIARGKARARAPDDDRLFPFSMKTAELIWEIACRDAGHLSIDEATNRKQIHPHMLRKFFRSQLSLKVPRDIVEALMGHEGYLDDAYRRYPRRQMAEFYLKGQSMLTISVPKEILDMQTDYEDRMNLQRETNERLLNQNYKLQSEVDQLRAEVAEARAMAEEVIEIGKVLRLAK